MKNLNVELDIVKELINFIKEKEKEQKKDEDVAPIGLSLRQFFSWCRSLASVRCTQTGKVTDEDKSLHDVKEAGEKIQGILNRFIEDNTSTVNRIVPDADDKVNIEHVKRSLNIIKKDFAIKAINEEIEQLKKKKPKLCTGCFIGAIITFIVFEFVFSWVAYFTYNHYLEDELLEPIKNELSALQCRIDDSLKSDSVAIENFKSKLNSVPSLKSDSVAIENFKSIIFVRLDSIVSLKSGLVPPLSKTLETGLKQSELDNLILVLLLITGIVIQIIAWAVMMALLNPLKETYKKEVDHYQSKLNYLESKKRQYYSFD